MSSIREINLSIDDLNIQALLEANHINISDLRPADIADALDLSPYNLTDIDETDLDDLIDLKQMDTYYLIMILIPKTGTGLCSTPGVHRKQAAWVMVMRV